jgi:hypothetical protein
LGNLSAIETIIGGLFNVGPQIESFFDRNDSGVLGVGGTSMVDGDYAQMVAINSELGVVPFDKINYLDFIQPGIQDPIYISEADDYRNVIFGVFFRADLQLRDYISPKRTLIDGQAPLSSGCNFNYFPVKSQKVPFYNWDIRKPQAVLFGGGVSDTIFGSQQNDWFSDPIDGTGFMSSRYQDLTREQQSSRYFRTSPNSLGLNYYPGFISAVDVNQINPVNGFYNYSASIANWDYNPYNNGKQINTGAPFYFYFGLKKGKSAYDRFAIKWISGQTVLTYE